MLKPLNDNVILKKEKISNMTHSGIIISTKEQDDDIATVIAVGDGIYQDGELVPMNVKNNDKVIYKKYSTTEVKFDNETYYVVSAKDILAIVKED